MDVPWITWLDLYKSMHSYKSLCLPWYTSIKLVSNIHRCPFNIYMWPMFRAHTMAAATTIMSWIYDPHSNMPTLARQHLMILMHYSPRARVHTGTPSRTDGVIIRPPRQQNVVHNTFTLINTRCWPPTHTCAKQPTHTQSRAQQHHSYM